jgi:V/A-type H+-transporting ATPase subunit D
MGVRYPADATCAPPDPSLSGGEVDSNTAVLHARTAYQAALQAAVRHATALAAVRAVQAELATTRHRLRALDQRWIPQLREALGHLELTLEEQEREDDIIRRRAIDTGEAR